MQTLVAQPRQHQSHVESVGAVCQDAPVDPAGATTHESNIVSAYSCAQLMSQVYGHVARCCQGTSICTRQPLPNTVHKHGACLIHMQGIPIAVLRPFAAVWTHSLLCEIWTVCMVAQCKQLHAWCQNIIRDMLCFA